MLVIEKHYFFLILISLCFSVLNNHRLTGAEGVTYTIYNHIILLLSYYHVIIYELFWNERNEVEIYNCSIVAF